MKLVVREAETSQLTAFLTGRGAQVATSALAVVEVLRAVRIAEPGADGTRRAIRRLAEAASSIGLDVLSPGA